MSYKVNFFLSASFSLFMLSFFILMNTLSVFYSGENYFLEWEIIELNSATASFVLIFDWVSLLFLGLVILISAAVLMFSNFYMDDDIYPARFVYLVLLFVFSMSMVILSPNIISILLGWDGLGLVSFLLVIYYQNFKSMNAGVITILSNRVGDVAILISIGLLFSTGSWNLLFLSFYLYNPLFIFSLFCFTLAGLTKSAQMPFSAWLPAAMAAPTPVSALVHSSTLVAAGVYLLIRLNYLISEIWWLSSILLFISSMTMFMAGICANYETDLKKIIALSTLSQLGLMMSAIALGFTMFAYFHLLTHALFKALLFMCAGALIHNGGGSQDIRFMGASVVQMPLVSVCLNYSNLALAGVPFLAGFYSKDLILETSWISNSNIFGIFLLYGATLMTIMYSFRLSFYSLWSWNQSEPLSLIGNETKFMVIPMMVLSLGSLLGGTLLIYVFFMDIQIVFINFYQKMLIIMILILGGWMGFTLNCSTSEHMKSKSLSFFPSSFFLSSMWFFPSLTGITSSNPLKTGSLIFKTLDLGWFELIGAQGLKTLTTKINMISQIMLLNSIKTY
ncbi:NADH dehydrogenase subunit 5 (mitochondrion) [Priapulus caudatus]|uniref:NADH-ubiquinone oxidoreductase chain 5 n=1 Tax=Priapulus caudatus TaxID=37621 RepID=A0MCU4_PRICU|nr:NADH dehydrogenase subunit 5 [Priapulus caudatus]ABE03639.1 NADH dehydrogenase subunit 5 [Priapulus caudatus]